MYGHGVSRGSTVGAPMSFSSIPVMLDTLKQEFEQLVRENKLCKAQRDDFEHKLQAQLAEMTAINQTIYDLKVAHTHIKQQYEEELSRWKGIAEKAGVKISEVPPPAHSAEDQGAAPSFPSPDVRASFGGPNKRPRTAAPTLASFGEVAANAHREPLGKDTSPMPPLHSPSMAMAGRAPHEPVPPRAGADHDDSICIRRDDWLLGYNPALGRSIVLDLLHNFPHQSVVCCVNFSRDGKYLATGCNHMAQIFNVSDGTPIATLSNEARKDADLYIRAVCFSPDGNLLATGAEDKTVKLWNVETKSCERVLRGHELDIYALDISRDGKLLISGSGDRTSKVWSMSSGACLHTLGNASLGPKDGVTSVAISPDSRRVATASLDRIVRTWDVETGEFLESYEGHLDSVYSVAFSPDGKSLASGSLDKTLKLWSLNGGGGSKCISTFNGHKDFVLSVSFSPDGAWLVSGSKDRSVQFWDPRNAVSRCMLQGHKNSVISVSVSPLGNAIATGSGDCRARLWSFEKLEPASSS